MTESELLVRQNIRDQIQMKQHRKSRRASKEGTDQQSVMAFDIGRQAKVTKYTTRGKEGFDINHTSSGLSK